MNVKLISYTPETDLVCGEAAALCTGYTGDPIKAECGALRSGHESVVEHAVFTFYIEGVSRVLLAQITRHRLASFSVQSQRYTGVKPIWIVPPTVKEKGFELSYMARCDSCYEMFCDMVSCGVPAEDARFIIPQGVECKLMLTMNPRELRHFYSLRCCNRAQWEIRQLADEMLRLCKEVAPVAFEDAGCACMAGKKCPEARPCGKPRRGDNV